MKFLSIITLLALLGCAGKKPVPDQTANANDDPRCEAYYEAINRNSDMEAFEGIKEEAKKYGIYLYEPLDLLEISNAQDILEIVRIGIRCKDTIFCKQKRYCLSTIDLKTGKVHPFI